MNEHIKHVSTPEYLKSLSIDQLRKAREIADEMIKKVESEDKIVLFVVSNGGTNEACFYENEFQQAKEKLCEVIMNGRFGPKDTRSFYPQIHRYVEFESEVAGWMELND